MRWQGNFVKHYESRVSRVGRLIYIKHRHMNDRCEATSKSAQPIPPIAYRRPDLVVPDSHFPRSITCEAARATRTNTTHSEARVARQHKHNSYSYTYQPRPSATHKTTTELHTDAQYSTCRAKLQSLSRHPPARISALLYEYSCSTRASSPSARFMGTWSVYSYPNRPWSRDIYPPCLPT